ncbi:MAG: hypothetical protein CMC55_02415 [Flavobacteriaceae bacterium]|uniref:DUF4296 domain-containing protein n=1 Tax=Bizionia echini TaxID=649333 RepID=UPI000C8A81E9|nr:hypothetical protein [Flavobacteriaceae bacterium]|tara:strand:- start:75 stop:515 length:441 start_codon:yes stop_codon:yes gene_type:complete
MKKGLIYFCIAVFFFNCGQIGKPKKPKNIIPEKEMVTILVDLALLSSAKGVNKKILENHGISPEEYVYNTHNIDSLQFLESNKYYSHNTKEYEVILKSVEDSLQKLKSKYAELMRIKEIKKVKAKDSILNNKKRVLDSTRKQKSRK